MCRPGGGHCLDQDLPTQDRPRTQIPELGKGVHPIVPTKLPGMGRCTYSRAIQSCVNPFQHPQGSMLSVRESVLMLSPFPLCAVVAR